MIHIHTNLLLVKDDGRMLFQERTDDAPLYPGMFSFYGGGVKQGESYKEGFDREIKNELNYQAKSPDACMIHGFSIGNKKGYRFMHVELLDVEQESSLIIGEGKKHFHWLTLDEVLQKPVGHWDHFAMTILSQIEGFPHGNYQTFSFEETAHKAEELRNMDTLGSTIPQKDYL